MFNTPAPMTKVATAELVKPSHVRSIRVWLGNCAASSVYVGVQYLDGRVNQLPETAFRALHDIVTVQGDQAPLGRFAQQEIDNDSLALEKLLRTHHDWFIGTVAPSSELPDPEEIWGVSLQSQVQQDAESLAMQGLWPEAIKQWTNLIRHSDGEQRRVAILARADALRASGEDYLAERECRGWLRYSDDAVLQEQAATRLLEWAGDNDRLREMILSFATIQGQTELFASQLARQFMRNGRHRFALQVLSSIEPDDQNLDVWLRCSYQIQWWTVFDQSVGRLVDPEAKNHWRGLKELKLGRYDHAYRLLRSGGADGAALLEYWQAGDRVFGKLTSPNTSIRLSGLADWEAWQSETPGAMIWRELPGAIRSASESCLVSLDHRGLHLPTRLVQQGQSATVEAYGPARLRLEVRPIHRNVNTDPIDDWIQIDTAGEIQRLPIVQNQPSKTSRIEGQDGGLPGQTETVELELAPGLNRFTVACESSRFLINVESLQSEISLPTLPLINAVSVAAVIKGSFGHQRHQCNISDGDCTDCVRMICRDRQCRSVPLSFDAMPCGCNELHSAQHYLERLSYQDAQAGESRALPTQQHIDIVGLDDVYRKATGFYGDAKDSVEESERLAAIVALHQLAVTYPDRSDVDDLLKPLMSVTKWEPYREFDSRAGIHSMAVEGWNPQSPKARVVAALFGDDVSTQVLSGSQQMTLMMNNPEPTEIEVILHRATIELFAYRRDFGDPGR